MDKEIIKKIIEAGNQAPSGGNSQPWKFKVNDNVIEVTGIPGKDHPVLNFRNRGTYVAIGALIENIGIEAASLGYNARSELSGTSVRITLELSEIKKDTELSGYIASRHSNRKPYKTDSFSPEEKSYLFGGTGGFPECGLIILEGDKIQPASKSLGADILVFLQNKLLHELLFKEILWKEEDQKSRPGLYVKTMEVAPPKSFVFGLLKNWKVARFIHKIKLTQKIYEENSAKIASSGLLGLIVTKDDDVSFVRAGGLLENIWLRAANLDLGFQLLTGTLFLRQQVNSGKRDIFSQEETDIIESSYKKLAEVAGVKENIIALAFRIGKADKPMATSYKRPPEIIWD